MNKQKDRLVELIKQGNKTFAYMSHIDEVYEFIADYLLADGWMRPPCKVGDFIYLIKENVIVSAVVESITYYKDSFSIKGMWWDEKELHPFISPSIVWGKEAFASKEEAEAKMKEGVADA